VKHSLSRVTQPLPCLGLRSQGFSTNRIKSGFLDVRNCPEDDWPSNNSYKK
jgi:hypothetical protein